MCISFLRANAGQCGAEIHWDCSSSPLRLLRAVTVGSGLLELACESGDVHSENGYGQATVSSGLPWCQPSAEWLRRSHQSRVASGELQVRLPHSRCHNDSTCRADGPNASSVSSCRSTATHSV